MLLAAFCFRAAVNAATAGCSGTRASARVRDWRERRAVPLRAKQLATVMMALGSVWAAFELPLPGLGCRRCLYRVAVWLWRLPTRRA